MVVWADVFDAAGEVIAEAGGQGGADFGFRGVGSSHEDGQGRGLGATDAFGMAMGAGRAEACLFEHVVFGREGVGDGADAHGGAVAEAVSGRIRRGERPAEEAGAEAAKRKTAGVGLEGGAVVGAPENGIRHGHGQDGVIGEGGKRGEQPEILVFGPEVLVDRTDDIARDGSEHGESPDADAGSLSRERAGCKGWVFRACSR